MEADLSSRSSWGVVLIVALLAASLLSACGFNGTVTFPTQVITLVPTSTLAPILTATERFTATLIPSDTLIPSLTLSATDSPPTATVTPPPSATPTVTVMAVVRTESGQVNGRSAPRTTYKKIGT